jgi:hypothetical protein
MAARDHIDVERVELGPATDAAGLVAAMRVEPEPTGSMTMLAAICEVEERVLEHGGRLDGRVILQAAAGVSPERSSSGVGIWMRRS